MIEAEIYVVARAKNRESVSTTGARCEETSPGILKPKIDSVANVCCPQPNGAGEQQHGDPNSKTLHRCPYALTFAFGFTQKGNICFVNRGSHLEPQAIASHRLGPHRFEPSRC